jgi:hypothetical protein
MLRFYGFHGSQSVSPILNLLSVVGVSEVGHVLTPGTSAPALVFEDAFQVKLPAPLVGIGPESGSAADLFLPHRSELVGLLDEVAKMIEG